MANAERGSRPLSPHLTIYRNQINMVTSILNRITGAGMILAAVMVVWWLLAAASDPSYFEYVNGIMVSWPACVIWVGSIWAFWFHFCGGIRHLIMDFGYGYELSSVNLSGWLVVAASVILTILTFLVLV